MVGLEDKADFLTADEREFILFEAGDIGSIQHDAAGGSGIETGEQTEERAFAGAGCAHDADELAGGNFEVNAFEDFDLVRAVDDGAGNVAYLDDQMDSALPLISE